MRNHVKKQKKRWIELFLMALLVLSFALVVWAEPSGVPLMRLEKEMKENFWNQWDETEHERKATDSNARMVPDKIAAKHDMKRKATPSDATIDRKVRSEALFDHETVMSSLGDIWDDWNGDFSFLDGSSGIGTKEKPYQIKTKNQLMGLSQLVVMGMRIRPGEGHTEIIGNYDGAYFKLMNSINLGGMDWNPIGFYQDTSEFSGNIEYPFTGHFDGNGKVISNFCINQPSWSQVGLFGMIEDAEIKNLTVKPNKTVTGKINTSLITATAKNSKIYNCDVYGAAKASGTIGGIVAEMENSVIENCTAHVTLDSEGEGRSYIGGIAGKAAGSSIVDCRVETGDNQTSRIQGKGIVGGIVGFQNDCDLYNVYVSGTIGGSGSKAVGGMSGQYASGHLKVARFEGRIGQSNLGLSSHLGTFIGTREAGNYFRYGTDVAYLFTDTESKIAYNICGSEIPDDNEYTYAAHIGYSHSSDLYYSLIQGGISKDITDTYFYQELENGISSILDEDLQGEGAKKVGYELDHVAPNDSGRPIRGYLVSIPQIDTVSSGTNYYDVAVLEVKGSSAFDRVIDKEHRGAIASGKTLTVTTSAKNTEDAKFQMDGVPTYIKNGKEFDTTSIRGGEYSFTMPEENTEVKAVYKKVAVQVSLPSECHISVVEERSGDRKHPVKITKVLNQDGKLIATYINGELEKGTQIQPIQIQAVIDSNNDVADSSVKWSIDDSELLTLLRNDEEDEAGYTKKSASIQVNLNARFFTDTIQKLEQVQVESNYQYPIPDTIYGAGHQNGGVAVLTAATRPASSFEEKPCTANCRINATFQVKDKTYVANEGAALDRNSLSFTVTRKLSGNSKNSQEAFVITQPQILSASFHPDFFDKKDITWKADDASLLSVNGEDKSASIAVNPSAKWIRDVIVSDQGIHENDPYAVLNGNGKKRAKVKVIADDMLGNRQTAECDVIIYFKTEDTTKIYAEGVTISPVSYDCHLICEKIGSSKNPSIIWKGDTAFQMNAFVVPEKAWNQKVIWKVKDDSLFVDESGLVKINKNAEWIHSMERSASEAGEHQTTIIAITDDGRFQASCQVTIHVQALDQTYSRSSSRGGGSSSSGGGGGRGSTSGTLKRGEAEIAATGPAAGLFASDVQGGITGIWSQMADESWNFTVNGRIYKNEWAYIRNPYAGKGQNPVDWFRFDMEGHMITGWFLDIGGKQYYLSSIGDGTKGHMYTGWKWIPDEKGIHSCYYFNLLSDGSRGALYQNCTTPDGFTVNERGQWIVNGVIQTK